jgi:hypothetical protein
MSLFVTTALKISIFTSKLHKPYGSTAKSIGRDTHDVVLISKMFWSIKTGALSNIHESQL